MASPSGYIVFFLLVSDEKIRDYLFDLLRRNRYQPEMAASLEDLLGALKGRDDAIVLLDTQSAAIYGVSVFSKIQAAVPGKRVILLCDQAHRHLIKEAMQHGSYGCILEPYAEWELLTIVRHILADTRPRKRMSGKSRKKS
ncbi:MAG: response regulator [Desulforhabdus sp.]|jgi:DNA-binding NtrC family response regulator|nr:response regulator [Desulforhabdus sp.]